MLNPFARLGFFYAAASHPETARELGYPFAPDPQADAAARRLAARLRESPEGQRTSLLRVLQAQAALLPFSAIHPSWLENVLADCRPQWRVWALHVLPASLRDQLQVDRPEAAGASLLEAQPPPWWAEWFAGHLKRRLAYPDLEPWGHGSGAPGLPGSLWEHGEAELTRALAVHGTRGFVSAVRQLPPTKPNSGCGSCPRSAREWPGRWWSSAGGPKIRSGPRCSRTSPRSFRRSRRGSSDSPSPTGCARGRAAAGAAAPPPRLPPAATLGRVDAARAFREGGVAVPARPPQPRGVEEGARRRPRARRGGGLVPAAATAPRSLVSEIVKKSAPFPMASPKVVSREVIAASSEALHIVQTAEAEAAQIRASVEAVREEARRKGYAEGYDQGASEWAEAVRTARASVASAVEAAKPQIVRMALRCRREGAPAEAGDGARGPSPHGGRGPALALGPTAGPGGDPGPSRRSCDPGGASLALARPQPRNLDTAGRGRRVFPPRGLPHRERLRDGGRHHRDPAPRDRAPPAGRGRAMGRCWA